MTLCEELYFDIKINGSKKEIKKFVSYLKSGELDEFFDITSDYFDYDDSFATVGDEEETSVTFVNDDIGIEIDEIDSGEFLEAICRAGHDLEIHGVIYDSDEEEYSFISYKGDSYYINAKNIKNFNDELDATAKKEEEIDD